MTTTTLSEEPSLTSRAADRPAVQDWVPGVLQLRDAWFPVAHVTDVHETVSRRQVHSQPYYLWRAKGDLHASEHRPDIAAAKRLPSTAFTMGTGDYPVMERYGYVWVWYGNPEKADESLVPDVPFLPREGGLPWYTRGTLRFDCCSALSLENLLDLTHADFLHANVVGDEYSEDDRIEVQSTSETVTMIRHCKSKSVAPIMRWVGGVRAKYQDVRAVIHVHVRNSVAIAYGRYTPGFHVPLFHPCVPESQDRCRLNFAMNTTAAPGPFRILMPRAAYIVGPQDNIMVGPQSARYAEPADRRDLHSRFDGAGTRYRFLMQQIARRQQQGDFSFGADPGRDVRELLGMPVL
ncbi:oxygenase [Paraburkholderia caffeinilytica]|uniref:Vanillate O-demethylase oxygenase-like C-terminal catalytic domain-containing protein n=1 Tax=Paraburkholderia caffeinilytica TaxID=1761016 RepID=A0ABQ1LPR9_9BURK|nr:oxygenase [Paraburkholderia caffeinilytica]GGC26960.1 hypothetical protein GCM10011400_11650 [Paraburkholderia caffeinilytica]CAB3779941.1 hypothetical protein LMG28690_00847 [Paraburkholderia caffeinilytica]